MGVPGIDGFVFTVEVRPHEGRHGGTASVDDARERESEVVAALATYAPFPSGISALIGDFEGDGHVWGDQLGL
jgi:hypothetical protein